MIREKDLALVLDIETKSDRIFDSRRVVMACPVGRAFLLIDIPLAVFSHPYNPQRPNVDTRDSYGLALVKVDELSLS